MKLNVDKLFQKKYEESDFNIPSDVWNNIQIRLKKRRLIAKIKPLIAISIFVLLTSVIIYSSSEKKSTVIFHEKQNASSKKITSDRSKDRKENQIEILSTSKPKGEPLKKVKSQSEKKVFVIAQKEKRTFPISEKKNNPPITRKKKAIKVDKKEPLKEKETPKTEKELVKKIPIKKPDSLKTLKKNEIPQAREKRWSITPVFGIFNTRRYDEISISLDDDFADNPSYGLPSLSYGYEITYKISNKFSIRTGVVLKEVRFIVKNLFLTDITGYNASDIEYISDYPLRFSNTNLNASGESNAEEVDLVQTIGYTEVPVGFRYALYNKSNFTTNLVFGFSFLHLKKNEIRTKTGYFSEVIAKSNNLLSTSLSYNLGLDVDYNISERFVFNAAILFKKHFNTYLNLNNTTGPFTQGIHVGVGYRF